jgi:uncharacterized protein
MTLSSIEKQRLKKKYGSWALVTGATSGIGLELAEQLASAGFNLIISSRHANRLNDTMLQIRRRHEVEIMVIQADMSDASAIGHVVQQVQHFDIGLLVLAAGFGTSGPFIDGSVHAEINMLRVNCESVLTLTHYYAQRFISKGRGGIILLSSMVAFQGVPYAANYAATKAYVQSLGEALAVELKPFGVDILAAAPGPVHTGFGARAHMTMRKALRPSDIGVPILKALGRKNTVLPGRLTKLLVYALNTIPRFLKIHVMKKVMLGMTNQRSKIS